MTITTREVSFFKIIKKLLEKYIIIFIDVNSNINNIY